MTRILSDDFAFDRHNPTLELEHFAMAAAKKKPEITNEHRQALAKGRSEGAAIRRYLVAIETHKPKRGRKRTPASMERRLKEIQRQLDSADALTRVHLIQERIDLEHQLEASDNAVDIAALEEEFIRTAKTYSERKKITYAAWREAGVDPAVLRKAGFRRTTS